jgi:hypothetical protein
MAKLKAVGRSSCAPSQQWRGMGSGLAAVRRQRHRPVGATWPWRARRVVPGEWGREAVRRKWGRGPRRAGTGGPKPASACGTAAHGRPV